MRPLVIVTFIGFTALPSTADAQSAADNVRISVNYGTQLTSRTFMVSMSQVTNLETQTITASYKVANGPVVDAGVAIRVAGVLGVGVSLSFYSKAQDATIAGSVPHPFFFNRPRNLDGIVHALEHKEVATHVQAVYLASVGHVDIALSGGPSLFSVRQSVVSRVAYTELYPYDSVEFAPTTTEIETATALGFNVGGDVGIRLSRHLAVGVLVRFSRASVDLGPSGGEGVVSLDAGGGQVAGGVRLMF